MGGGSGGQSQAYRSLQQGVCACMCMHVCVHVGGDSGGQSQAYRSLQQGVCACMCVCMCVCMSVESVEDSLKRIARCVCVCVYMHYGAVWLQLCCIRLVGIMLLVYIKHTLKPHVSDVEVDQVPTGMHGIMVRGWGSGAHRDARDHGKGEGIRCPQGCTGSW